MVAAGTPRAMSEGDADEEAESRVSGLGWREPGECAPRAGRRRRSPRCRGRACRAGAEEGGDGPGPEGFSWFLFWIGKDAGELHSSWESPPRVAAEAAEVFEDFGVEDGGADFVDAGGPFAEVDLAAAVAAEGEVFVVKRTNMPQVGQRRSFFLGGFFLPTWRTTSPSIT
jgi:hypothetical protein